MMLKPDKRIFTAREYFEIEECADCKSEYYHAELFAMAGGTPNHNRIVLNVAGKLNAAFGGKGCEAFACDIRVEIDKDRHFAYPDVLVICGKPEFAQDRRIPSSIRS